MSRLRKTSRTFSDLPISKGSVQSGITIIYLPTGSVSAQLVYQSSCEEIYDIQMLADTKRPGIMGLDPRREPAILTPGGGFWGVKVKEEKAEQPATEKSFEEETTEQQEWRIANHIFMKQLEIINIRDS